MSDKGIMKLAFSFMFFSWIISFVICIIGYNYGKIDSMFFTFFMPIAIGAGTFVSTLIIYIIRNVLKNELLKKESE